MASERSARWDEPLFDAIPDAVLVVDQSRRVVFANAAVATVFGYQPADIVGSSVDNLLPTLFQPAYHDGLERIFANPQVAAPGEPFPLMAERADGCQVAVSIRVSPFQRIGETFALAVIRDIHENHQLGEAQRVSEMHFRILAQVLHALQEAPADPTSVLEIATAQLAASLGDACVVAMIDDAGEHLVPTVFHHKDPYGEEVMREIFLSGPVILGAGIAGEVAATGEPTNISGIPTDQMKASVRSEYQSYFDSFKTSSVLVVPIKTDGGVIGTIGLSREAPYTKSDQALLEDIAVSISVGLSRATLSRDLADSQAMLTAVADNVPAAIGYWDRNLRNVYANKTYLDLVGTTAEQCRGKHASEILGPDQFAAVLSHLKAAIAGEPQVFDREIVNSQGVTRHVQATYVPDLVDDEVAGVFVLLVDNTERVEVEREVERRERLFRLIFDHAPQGIAVLGADFSFQRVNEALSVELDRDPKWLMLRKFTDLLEGAELKKFIEHASQLSSGAVGRVSFELRLPGVDGRSHWVRCSMAVIQDHESTSRSPGGSALFVCNFEEITAARSRRQKLEYRARHDSLTGLLNRDAFKEILAAVKHGRRGTDSAYALMFCDLDYFKDINDRYGHLLGDAVLETVADRIQSAVRKSDIVARLGGDEFVVLLSDVDSMDACYTVAEKIHESLEIPMKSEDLDVELGVTIGVCIAAAGSDPQLVLNVADEALYEEKVTKRGSTRIVDLRL